MQSPAEYRHHQSRHQYQRTADQPRVSYGALGAAPPSPLVAAPKKPPSLARVRRFLRRCLVQTVFLTANAGLAACAGLLSLALLGCALVSLPLCCAGVLVFRLIFRVGVVSLLAKADVTLANTVLPPENRIRLEPALPSARDPLLRSPPPLHPLLREDRVLDRVISNLATVAPAPVATLVYFAAFKWMLALLGLGLVWVLLWVPLALLQSLSGAAPPHSLWHGPLLLLAFAAAVSSLNLATRICCSCTRLFCCERDRECDSPALTKVVVVHVADGW